MRLIAILFAGLLVVVPLAASAVTIVVDVGDTGDHTTIQAGIDAASEGDTVLVYPGTYTGEGNRDIEFGTKNIVLRGRDGAETTLIDNQGVGDYRLFIFRSSGQDTTCVIDGFTIAGGRQNGTYYAGAGILIDGTPTPQMPTSPKFMNCVVRGNQSWNGPGGGVFINTHCEPVFRNVRFESNYARTGGGGAYCIWWSNVRFSNCTFVENQNVFEGAGGGLYCKFDSDVTLVNCIFEENIANAGGGFASYDSSPTLTNVTFLGNLASAAGGGGAVHCEEASPTLTNVTCCANRAQGDGQGEALYAMNESHPTLVRSLFAFSGYAPASRSSADDSTLSTSATAGAASDTRGLSFYCDATSGFSVLECCSYGNVSGNDICSVTCGERVPDLICEDPLFCDPGAGDFRLAPTSPCLPANNTWGVLIGAHGEGCAQPSVRESSWGAIKALYR